MLCDRQTRLVELDAPRRLENLQKLEEIKKHLMELEKQVTWTTFTLHFFFYNTYISYNMTTANINLHTVCIVILIQLNV